MQSFLRSLFGADGAVAGRGDAADEGRAVFGEHIVLGDSDLEILGERFARRDLRAGRFRPVPTEVRAELGGFGDEAPDAAGLVPTRDEVFIRITASMAEILQRMAQIEANPHLRTFVLLTGPTGCGKTTMVKTYCHLANEPCVELTFSGDTTLADFFQRTEVVRGDSGQSTVAALGPAVQAMLHGHKLLINEINMLPPDLVSALTQAMDTGRLVISGTDLGNIEIEVHEQFGVFATANPNYVGAAEIGRALQRRFGWGLGAIPMEFLPPAEEADAVAFEFGRLELAEALDLQANPSIVERLVGVASQLRGHAELGGSMRDRISTRSLVHWLALGHATGLPLAEIGAQAVLSVAPDDLMQPVADTTRQALGRAVASTSYPDELRQALLDVERPDAGAAVALPAPALAAGPEASDGWAGVTLDLEGGRKVRIRGGADRPPVVESANGTDGMTGAEVRRALRAEYGLNLASSLGHVPPAPSVLPCLTASSWQALRLTQGALVAGRPVFLRGPTGCGKSAMARTLAHLWNLPAVEFSLTGETSKTDLTAARRLTSGATSWSIQGFLEAASEGLFVIVNEYNLAYPDVHSIINGLFDKGGRLLLPDGRVVHAHPDFRLVATGFAEGPGVKPLNEAVENRFGAVIRMDYPPLDEEAAILAFVADDLIEPALLHSAAELAATGRAILSGAWDREARHPLNAVPADLAGAAAERVSLTTAELVTSARAGEDSATFVRWLRRGVLEGAGDDVRPVLEATLAGYGLV
jgi:MoxR-like ATPase